MVTPNTWESQRPHVQERVKGRKLKWGASDTDLRMREGTSGLQRGGRSFQEDKSIAAQFTTAKCWKQPKCLSVNEWIKKLWYIYMMECVNVEWNVECIRSRKKEVATTLCDSMDGTGEHYAKWNKPGGEWQIPYDLTFNWNLINKMNKQAKYNQRHWN